MATPYEVSTVVSRSYISEQLQDGMQKGQEQKNTAFLAEFQKEYDKKGKEVNKSNKSEETGLRDKYINSEAEQKKRNRKKQKDKRKDNNKNVSAHGIDIKA